MNILIILTLSVLSGALIGIGSANLHIASKLGLDLSINQTVQVDGKIYNNKYYFFCNVSLIVIGVIIGLSCFAYIAEYL